jgi:hypothetical protein
MANTERCGRLGPVETHEVYVARARRMQAEALAAALRGLAAAIRRLIARRRAATPGQPSARSRKLAPLAR